MLRARKGKILIKIYSKRSRFFSKTSKLIPKRSKLIFAKQKPISESQKLSKLPKLISKSPKFISAGFHLSGLDWISHQKKPAFVDSLVAQWSRTCDGFDFKTSRLDLIQNFPSTATLVLKLAMKHHDADYGSVVETFVHLASIDCDSVGCDWIWRGFF